MRFFMPIVLAAVLIALSAVAGIHRPASAQTGAPATGNIVVRDGSQPGEVIISWDAVAEATHYRIGYVNMATDYPLAKASVTGEWIEAFVYVDVNARNFVVSGGRTEYTVRRLAPGVRHAFTVLTSDDFVDTGAAGSVSSEFSWPSNPRWRFHTVADRSDACPGATETSANAVPGGSVEEDRPTGFAPRPALADYFLMPSFPVQAMPGGTDGKERHSSNSRTAVIASDGSGGRTSAQTGAPATGNIVVRDGSQPGEVIISWDAVAEATHYRIGYVNMATDYPLAKASVTGEWIEAFVYVDVNARNFVVSGGRTEYTVRRLAPGVRHAFTVLTSDDFVDTGAAGSVSSEFSWPSNPRWRFHTVADRSDACPSGQVSDRPYLYEPISPPVAPAYIDWRWESDQDGFRELVTDFTIHNDVGDWSDQHGYYLILLQNFISDAGFYFGLQTDANGRGKAVIFSRWGTSDVENAVWSQTDGWTESAGHEGDFIGVRRSYDWSAGDYRIEIAPEGLDPDGAWFGLRITDLDTNSTTWIGSLKFPLLNGAARIRPYSSATIELYGNPPIRPIDIPQWHVSVKRPLGDHARATWGFTSYPFDNSDNALLNSDVWYDAQEEVAHLWIGGATKRRTPAEGRIDFPSTLCTLSDPETNGRLARLELDSPALAIEICALPWVADGIAVAERRAAELLPIFAAQYPDVFIALLQKPWFRDNVTIDKFIISYSLSHIASHSESDALSILGMEFLDSIGFADAAAATSLYWLLGFGDGDGAYYERIMSHPTLSDGITNEEAKIVALLHQSIDTGPESAALLLDGTGVYLEERVVELPLSGETLLTIIRLRDRETLSMDLLEHGARVIEAFIGEPYLTHWIALFFDDVPRGGHFGTHMTLTQDYDEETGWLWQYTPFILAHETAHYYWSGGQAWINEGTAQLLGYLSEHARIGAPIEATYFTSNECPPSVTTLAQLEMADLSPSQSACPYYLGEAIFLDLYHSLGEETFRQGFRNLYLKSAGNDPIPYYQDTQWDDPTDDCEGNFLGICHLAAAFKAGMSDEVAAKVDEIVARWYYGTTP